MITLRSPRQGLAFGSRRSARLIERNLYVYKHGWLVVLTGFFEPLFYLLAMGYGLGALIGTIHGPTGADQLRRLHRARAAGHLGDERGDLRLDDQLLLQAQLHQDLRRDAGDVAGPGRRGRSVRSAGR